MNMESIQICSLILTLDLMPRHTEGLYNQQAMMWKGAVLFMTMEHYGGDGNGDGGGDGGGDGDG